MAELQKESPGMHTSKIGPALDSGTTAPKDIKLHYWRNG